MKKLAPFALILFCLFSTKLRAQIAFYDAQSLKSVLSQQPLSTDSFKKASGILAKYLLADNLTVQQVQAQYANNPFIPDSYKTYIPPPGPMAIAITTNSTATNNVGTNLSNSVGGLPITNIANGIAQFLINRAKEELTIAFFDRFKKFADQHPEFKIL